MLVRVRDAGEAKQAAAAGADSIELCIDGSTAVDLSVARAVRSAFPGLLRLRVPGPSLRKALAQSLIATDADEIAFAIDETLMSGSAVDTGFPAGLRSVGILTDLPEKPDAIRKLRDHVDTVILDPGSGARLVDTAGIAALDAFASACRKSELAFGLTGGLEAPDVSRLLLLQPDVLAFDTAVRQGHAPDAPLDPDALDAIRALIPRQARDGSSATIVTKVTDRVFVRDFEVSLAIGAYQAEHGTRQRVRFSIVADVVREPMPPRDMRDVFSYDVIIETIRVLSERAHVTFVETLAEEVAASLLTHAEVAAVNVKVEKLDVIAGAVGIEIVRRSTTP